jgi:hypothetical protein
VDNLFAVKQQDVHNIREHIVIGLQDLLRDVLLRHGSSPLSASMDILHGTPGKFKGRSCCPDQAPAPSYEIAVEGLACDTPDGIMRKRDSH